MRREATLIPRYDGGPFRPGDVVAGVIVPREPLERLRSLTGELRYVDRSPSFSGAVTYGPVVPLHEGALAAGQEVPFSLRLPGDAYPNWDDAETAKYGELKWSLVLQADIQAGLDTTTAHSIPVDADGGTWTGPPPTGEERWRRLVDNWDVELIPDRWALRRGEELTVHVRIGKPKSDRPKLQMAVTCRLYYDVETSTRDSDGDTSYRRERNFVKLFEVAPTCDPSLPEQSFSVRVPEDAPFSYDGKAFGFVWQAIAMEKRRWYQSDAGRVATLEVMP
ncbi:MAG TPA: hypothetical protein VK307_02090 [Thermoleophilaceae bacterium]|nr:hypothetical protein [Thermoleophilaceae bacterium]